MNNKKTIFQVIYERLKHKPTTQEELNQLKLDLEREQLKTKIYNEKSARKGTGQDKLKKVLSLFDKVENTKTPRF